MTLQTLTLPTLITDNQDGGFSATIYTDKEERRNAINKILIEDYEEKPLTENQIENEDYDTYQHGYPGTVRLELKIDAEGNISLWKQAVLHGGQ